MNRFVLCILFTSFVATGSSTFGQTEKDFQSELQKFREFVAKDQFSKARRLGDPKIDDIIAIAERAQKKIFTPDDNELRRMARDFESKLTDLQTSDMGRWVAKRPKSVATFIQFDTEQIELSDGALERRRNRLAANIAALQKYTAKTQGDFDPSRNRSARMIIEDANWVESKYLKLQKRLAVMADIKTNFPKGQDFSKSPTLQEAKNTRIAKMFEQIQVAELEAQEKALRESSNRIARSTFDRQIRKTETKIAGDEMLADLERKLMDAEYGRQATELEKRIMETNLAKDKIELQARLAKSNAKKEMATLEAQNTNKKLEEYLTSARVKELLAPFCNAGRCEATTGNGGYKRINSLEDGPVSLARLGQIRCLEATDHGMRLLIRVANFTGNERPSWPITDTGYSSAKKDFKNIDGDMVNRYIEAQRILREHGSKLIELKMLRR